MRGGAAPKVGDRLLSEANAGLLESSSAPSVAREGAAPWRGERVELVEEVQGWGWLDWL